MEPPKEINGVPTKQIAGEGVYESTDDGVTWRWIMWPMDAGLKARVFAAINAVVKQFLKDKGVWALNKPHKVEGGKEYCYERLVKYYSVEDGCFLYGFRVIPIGVDVDLECCEHERLHAYDAALGDFMLDDDWRNYITDVDHFKGMK